MGKFVGLVGKIVLTLKDDTTDKKLTEKKKLPTLRKNKRVASQHRSRHKLQHILFCPTAQQQF